MKNSKSELIKLLRNVPREGWSNQKIKDLVDSLWRDPSIQPDELIYGGIVTWRTGLTNDISRTIYRLGGKIFQLAPGDVTHDPADATYTRIDVIAVNIYGQYEVIKGTPSANPLKPSVDPGTQLYLTDIIIPAAATEPEGVSNGIVYNEYVAGEWTPSAISVAVDWENTDSPSVGSKCASAGLLSNGDLFIFTAPEAYNSTDWLTFSFDLRLPNINSKGNNIEVFFTLNGAAVSDVLTASFSRSDLAWQKVVFAIPQFNIRNTVFDGIVIRWFKQGAGTYPGIKLDNLFLQKGIALPKSVDGKDGITPHIGLNGNWYIGDIDTGIPATGPAGADGTKPVQVTGLTLLAANWVTDGTLKKYVLSHASITATSIVEVIPANASIAIVKAAEVLPETDSAAGSVSIWATNTPTGDISVTINIYETV